MSRTKLAKPWHNTPCTTTLSSSKIVHLLWWVTLGNVIPPHITQVGLHGMRHLLSQVCQFDSLASQLPLVPLIRFHDVWLQNVCVSLCAAVTLGDWFLNHLTRLVLWLWSTYSGRVIKARLSACWTFSFTTEINLSQLMIICSDLGASTTVEIYNINFIDS